MGQLLGVERLISGSVGRLGKTLVMLNMRIIDINSGKLIAVVARDIRGEIEDVVAHLADLSHELLGEKKSSAGDKQAPPASPTVAPEVTGPAPAAPAPAAIAQEAPSVKHNKQQSFINRMGIGISAGNILVPQGYRQVPDKRNSVGIYGLHLSMRLAKFIEFNIGLVVPVFDLVPESGNGMVSYRRVPQPTITHNDGNLKIEMRNNSVGFSTDLGLAFNIGKRFALYGGCGMKSISYYLKGTLSLPQIGASIPENIYGDDTHTMVLFSPRLQAEVFALPKLSLVLAAGAALNVKPMSIALVTGTGPNNGSSPHPRNRKTSPCRDLNSLSGCAGTGSNRIPSEA